MKEGPGRENVSYFRKNVTENKIPDTLIAKGVLRLFFVKKSPGVISGLPFTGCKMLFSIDFPYEGHIVSHGGGGTVPVSLHGFCWPEWLV